MFHDLSTKSWSLKMICENFEDWLLQGCLERDRADSRFEKFVGKYTAQR